jgi:hypothetical protein
LRAENRYVGNTMATFVMQTLGCDVGAINTVQFSKFQRISLAWCFPQRFDFAVALTGWGSPATLPRWNLRAFFFARSTGYSSTNEMAALTENLACHY